MYMKLMSYALVLLLTSYVKAQNPVTYIEEQVSFLADDRLEGRATGSKGEEIAANYIAGQFAAAGLQPAGENKGFFQVFDFAAGKQASNSNYVEVPGVTIVKGNPIYFSGSGKVTAPLVSVGYGITAMELNYDDYEGIDVQGKIVCMQLSTPEGTHPHTKFLDYADERSKVARAMEAGAVAVLFYNTDENYTTDQLLDYSNNASQESIPVLLLDRNNIEQLLKYPEVNVCSDLQVVRKNGKNVAAMINNKAACTIVIGAHYDHLGYGESGGSLYRGEPAIHNGADDNASGIALILQLAKDLASSNNKGYNYVFIAFSGEELGLYGSKSAAEKLLDKDACYNYMLNFDMVGRLDSTRQLIVNGFGTSGAWSKLESLAKAQQFQLKTFESGIGPSDHTSFYLKQIPVLHFFTGSHSDYHKPTDDADKVNAEGIADIELLVRSLIADLDDEPQIDYIKTKEDTNEDAPRFTVTMGVIPDYAYEGRGMRIDGVSDGKPAAAAGIQAGDVVINLGGYDVADMMGYMKALSKFKAGDATTVTFIRNEATMEKPIQF
ncbi:MAG: hypothetical protein ABR95_03535 [Sphingobacteriales bacterium BACL12 MAG-120813-bin55]|jgi:aminopeptidase YwaD|nr:MAG: hypothetical protein ABR94_09080 [Sphingobacteriales bacterium BACL12 MAG-120802-bin5]KRP12410.1 MAG: hypothetical protein ABR95_03535 [Sphingobacteriales bacterium BACL12 MAG-120813-bin55]